MYILSEISYEIYYVQRDVVGKKFYRYLNLAKSSLIIFLKICEVGQQLTHMEGQSGRGLRLMMIGDR